MSHKKNNYSPLQMVFIALAVALISYVPVRTVFNIATKGSIRAETAEQVSKNLGAYFPADISAVDFVEL